MKGPGRRPSPVPGSVLTGCAISSVPSWDVQCLLEAEVPVEGVQLHVAELLSHRRGQRAGEPWPWGSDMQTPLA